MFSMYHYTSPISKLILYFGLIACALILMAPAIFGFIISTQSLTQVYSYPPRFSPGSHLIQNYSEAFVRVKLGRLILNSLLISVIVATVKIVISILAGFAFAYFDFKGKNLIFFLSIATIVLPVPVRLIPTYQLVRLLGWVDTYYALTVPFFASFMGSFLFRQFYLTVPASLSDAAKIDGCSPMKFLFYILLPLSYNNIAALFVVQFIYMWTQYLWPLVATNSDTMRVVQIGIKMLMATEGINKWNLIMAGATVALIPPLVILLTMRKWVVRGVTLQIAK